MDLQVVNSDTEDTDIFHPTNRRPSLSRFRSCPQLQVELASDIQIYDIDIEDDDDYFRHGQLLTDSPLIHRKRYGRRTDPGSQTPTPPSSPRSQGSQDSLLRIGGISPSSASSTPRMLRQKRRDPCLRRVASGDSGSRRTEDRLLADTSRHSLNFERENYLRGNDMTVSNYSLNIGSSEGIPGIICDDRVSDIGGDFEPHAADTDKKGSQEKCEKWLQSLHLTQADKLKSRSQMHLKPV